LGTRCEIKNLNSVRFVMQAIDHEARRQVALIEAGGAVAQQTRLYDSARGETRHMRSKENDHDYRYFPDPDLLPLVLEPEWLDRLRAELPELPDAKKARFITDHGLSAEDAEVLVAERATAEYFEKVAEGRDPKAAANWVMGDLFGALNRLGLGIEQSPVTPGRLGALIDLIADGTISGRIAKDLFVAMEETGKDPAVLVEERGMKQVTDTGAIDAAIEAVIAANPDKVEEVKAKPKLAAWFVGQVMKQTGGKANPAAVNAALKTRLNLPDEG
jgi:aspartyl-tRNA(Asn)/glutamyl-tRNA(Gln) amidotransferase subunit B